MPRLLVLFFASGCAALIYETVWFYLVQLVVGASSHLSGGAAVRVHGRDGARQLAAAEADAEGHASVQASLPRSRSVSRSSAIAIPLALPYIQQVYLTLAEPGAGADHAPRRGVLPRAHAADDADGRDAAGDRAMGVGTRSRSDMLYMANLAGGATGTVLAGFYLLRVYDTVVATAVAVSDQRHRSPSRFL